MIATLIGLWLAASAAADAPVEVAAQVLDAEGKPLEDAVVFMRELPGKAFSPPTEPAVMDQVKKEFAPHVLAVLVGTRVRFPNSDDIHHHLYSFSDAKKVDLPLYKGEPAEPIVFDKPGVVKLGCNIHDWMRGVILVVPTPYFAKTGPDGKAALSAPAMEAELVVFHERLRGPVDATRKPWPAHSGALTWRLELKKPGGKRRPAMKY